MFLLRLKQELLNCKEFFFPVLKLILMYLAFVSLVTQMKEDLTLIITKFSPAS